MKTLFTLVFLTICIGSMGQSQFDQRLLARYSEDRIAELNENQPSTIEYWTYYLDHSYTIVDGEATGKTIDTDEVLKIKDLENFNVLDLGIHMDGYRAKYYKVKGSDQYFVLKSSDQFSKEFSRNRSSK